MPQAGHVQWECYLAFFWDQTGISGHNHPQEGKTEIKTLSRCLGGVACLLGAAAFMGSVRTSNQAQSRLQHKTDPESCEDQSQGDQSESGYLSQYHGKGHGCELFLLACWGCRHTGISQGKKAGISRGM
jgi:hypothetical protein